MDGDPDIQSKVLECILNWKDSHLTPYEDHLKNLISPKMAREEMTTWNIGKESENVQPNHRDGLVTTIMRLLFPKILKTKTSLHNKVIYFDKCIELYFIAEFKILICSLRDLDNRWCPKEGGACIFGFFGCPRIGLILQPHLEAFGKCFYYGWHGARSG